MMTPHRPLPTLDEPDTAPFWTATRGHRLRFQTCDRCQAVIFHPRRHCPRCGGLDTTWHDSEGRGKVYSFTVVRQHGIGFFAERVPYAVGLVDLDEGFRMMVEIVADDLETIEIDMRVGVVWEDHEEISIPLFAVDPHA